MFDATDSSPRLLVLIIPPVTRGWAPVTGYPLTLYFARRRDTGTLASGSFLRRRLAFYAAAPRASILREDRGVGLGYEYGCTSRTVCVPGQSALKHLVARPRSSSLEEQSSRRTKYCYIEAKSNTMNAIEAKSAAPALFCLGHEYMPGRGSLPLLELEICPFARNRNILRNPAGGRSSSLQ
jgi:hypothetical protein